MNILQIENSRLLKVATEDVINALEYNYYGAGTMIEAFKILSEVQIDLIITGLELEDGEGEYIVEKLIDSDFSYVPVVVLTSTDDIEVRTKLFNLGIVDYQLKSNFTSKKLKAYMEMIRLNDNLLETLRAFKVAVVDDSILSLKVIKNIFTLSEVTHVDYFTDAKSLLESKLDYELYVLDLILPESSGEDLIYYLREHGDNIIILISSTSNYKTISHTLNAGADDFIVKPFDANTFIVRIKSHIKKFLLMKELEEKNKMLLEASITDRLTGLFNRGHLMDRFNDEIERAQRYDSEFAIILLDIDNFKNVNDTYGHQAGDLVLKRVARTIHDTMRNVDCVGRYGGEEFMVILPHTGLEDAKKAGEKIRVAISEIDFGIPGLRTTISGGIAPFMHFDGTQMIKHADENLYKAKKRGKNMII